MNFTKQLLIAAFTCLSLASCDPIGQEKYIIYNAGSQPIMVENGVAGNIDTTYTIAAGQSLDYRSNSGIGFGDDPPPADNVKFSQIYSVRRDTTPCRKDHTFYSGWNKVKNSKRNYTYTLVVSDTDF